MDDLLTGLGASHTPTAVARPPSPPPLPPGEDARGMHPLFDFDLFSAPAAGAPSPPSPPDGDGAKPVHTIMSNATSSGGGDPLDTRGGGAPIPSHAGWGEHDDDYIMQIMFGEPAAAVPRRVTAHLHTWESAEWGAGADGPAAPGAAPPRGSLDALLGLRSVGGEVRVALHRLVPLGGPGAPAPAGAPGVPPAGAPGVPPAGGPPPRPAPPSVHADAGFGVGGWPPAAAPLGLG